MNLVIIGYGGMGGYHAQKLKEYNEGKPIAPITVIGVYDIDKQRELIAQKNGYKIYSNQQEIWADKNVDAVLIATPNDVHAMYVMAASKAGKNMICEKPIGMNCLEAEQMYAFAKEANIIFSIHQNRRWDDDFLTIKNIFDNSLIGDVYCIESRVMGSNGIPGAWRKEKAHGGGMMLDWGVHLIDQMLQMVKSPIQSLYCEYSYIYGEEVDDGCNLTVNFENGIKYRIIIATDCFRNLPRWQVYGTQGTATINDWNLSGGITRVLVRDDKNIIGIKAGNGFTRTMAPRIGNSIEQINLPIVHAEPFAFYKNFAASCLGKIENIIKSEEVIRVFKVMEAAERSAKQNIVIKDKL